MKLVNSRVAAFGSSRRPNTRPETDANLQALLATGMDLATLVCKNSILQVTQVLRTTPEENLNMIYDSIQFLRSKGMEVFYDAEHFFDGFKADKEYALQCLRTASEAGATSLILCDTNGGAMPDEIEEGVKAACSVTSSKVYTSYDSGLGVANPLQLSKPGHLGGLLTDMNAGECQPW